MEYKKDTRTKNLTLRDIHVGDWVQVWSEQAERYSPPLKIISIHDDGTIYLVTSDEERSAPWEEDIKNVDAIPITPYLLKGFGFEIVKNNSKTDWCDVFYNADYMGELRKYSQDCELKIPWYRFKYFHEFIDGMYNYFPELLNLQWKGIKQCF